MVQELNPVEVTLTIDSMSVTENSNKGLPRNKLSQKN